MKKLLFAIFLFSTAVMAQGDKPKPLAPRPKPAAAARPFLEFTKFDWKNGALAAVDFTATNLDLQITRANVNKPGNGERDPLWRPFIHNRSVYAIGAATNVATKMLGDWMRHSQHRWVRNFWWAPQAADATLHFVGWRQWKTVEAQERCWARTGSQGCFQ